MKNLTTAGDITYFTINNVIYGIDATDGSAVECHDEESPAVRIDYQDLVDALSGDLLLVATSTITHDFESKAWHFEGFDLVERAGHWEIVEFVEV